MCESHVFEEERSEGNDWRLQRGEIESIQSLIPRRVYQGLELGVHSLHFGRQSLPRLCQARDGDVTQSQHDGEEGVQILVLFAAAVATDSEAVHLGFSRFQGQKTHEEDG